MKAYLALGSNLGDRLANLRQARELLSSLALNPIESAGLYETDPFDCPPDSPAFLNTAIAFETALSPEELLTKSQEIEQELGRESQGTRPRNSPRPVDIDLLICDEEIRATSELTLPHPRLHERLFVLFPLRDLAPTLVPPTHANPVSFLLELCESPELPPILLQEKW
ncbi:2-amino-4-hydroxy-6-hydroxymethyldihydropteridine diphosphokinase [Roseibacillus persicicus]|uniref:2-amino-4-hydroxy-6- hydroxymethyldihydropteridine diphosphokinase n=1 Tax=Roseibacillus persicicus TaxID=454148 RepID=UPI00398A5167